MLKLIGSFVIYELEDYIWSQILGFLKSEETLLMLKFLNLILLRCSGL